MKHLLIVCATAAADADAEADAENTNIRCVQLQWTQGGARACSHEQGLRAASSGLIRVAARIQGGGPTAHPDISPKLPAHVLGSHTCQSSWLKPPLQFPPPPPPQSQICWKILCGNMSCEDSTLLFNTSTEVG